MKNKKPKRIINIIKMNKNLEKKEKFKLLINFFFFILIFPIYISKENIFLIRKLNLDADIIVTIKGTGDQFFLYEWPQTRPDSASVQDSTERCDIYTRKCYSLVREINNVTMKWNSKPKDFTKLFFCLENITHIYFLNLDVSEVTTMDSMFYGCNSLVSIHFNNFNTSSCTDMYQMFRDCSSLSSIDLSIFDTSKVTRMTKMFQSCTSLTSLNLSNFETSSLELMDEMFTSCRGLKTLNLSNFDTSKVTKMSHLFYGCRTLESIDINNFNTKSLIDMGGMFRECFLLKSLDLTNFNTSSVTSMSGLFEDDISLISVNLSNLDTGSLEKMNNMFYNCTSLKNLDVNNIDVSKVTTMDSMFYGCYSLTTLDLSGFVTSSLESIKTIFTNCHSLISINLDNFDTSNVVDMSLMFYNCTNLISLNLKNFDTSSVTNTVHDIFTFIDTNLIFCSDDLKIAGILHQISFTSDCSNNCFKNNQKILVENKQCTLNCSNDNIYKVEYNNICYKTCPNDTHVTSDNINLCQLNPEGYYLDGDIYEKCYSSCKSCNGEGNDNNHNCINCISEFIRLNETGKENNCYRKCDYYYYFETSGNYECTSSAECEGQYNKKIEEKGKCIDECNKDDKYQFEFDNICFEKCPNNTYVSENNNYLCLSDPDNYYLDIDIYRACYSTCKKCSGEGDENNNNCLSCISGYMTINENNKQNNCYPSCGDYYYYFENSVYKCTTNNICPEGQSKFIQEKKKCIDNCTNDDTYKVEYNNICYIICPDNTHLTIDNNYLCQSNPDGYYLDTDNIYKHCYELCKKCYGEGDENNHNCQECVSNYNFINEGGIENNCYQICEHFYFDSSGYHCTSSSECPEGQKYIKDGNRCIDNCTNDNIYQVEYNGICYETCPNDTHLTEDNNYLCQLEPEGYYLQDNIYEKCYSSCKTCNGEGNDNNHNCINCISDFIKINEIGKEKNCYKKCDYYYFFDNTGNYHCTSNNECEGQFNKLIPQKKKCTENCNNDNTYIVEYNNICVQTCPEGYNITENNSFLCIKIPEDSITNENIHNSCYQLCEQCIEEGTIDNNKCQKCIENYMFLEEPGKEGNCYIKCNYFYYFDISGNYKCSESNICPEGYNKLINEKKKCIDNCTNDDKYKLEYNNTCNQNCPTNTHLTIDNNYLCQLNPKGYYLDNNIYKPCYDLCESCNAQGNDKNNNCIKCISNYEPILNPDNIKNCYKKCDFYYYFDNLGNYHCTEKNECPEEQKNLIQERLKCIDDCSKDEIFIYEDHNICVKFSPEKTTILICEVNLPFEKNNECVETCSAYDFLKKKCKLNNKGNIEAKDNMIKIIQEEIKKGNLNELISDIKEEKKDYIVDDSETTYQLTSSENQNNNEYNNISTILLGDCEEKLKKHYGIGKDETLIIFKLDIHQEGLLIPLVEYDVYNPLNLEKLNLSYCEDSKIGISIPVEIDENNLFKYNSSHEYYNDICYAYTTDSGTDIAVKDRQDEYVYNNLSLCESDCEYTYYNTTSKKATCECKAKLVLNSISDIKDNKDILLKTFMDIKIFINLNILKCYNNLFNKEGLLKNAGSYALLSIIFIHLVSLFIFKIKGFNIIYNTIQNLVKEKTQNTKNMHTKSGKNLTNIYKNKMKRKKIIKKSSKKLNKEKLGNPPYKKNKNKSSKLIGVNEDISLKSNSKLELKFSEKKLGTKKKLSQKIPFLKKSINNKKEKKKINIDNNKMSKSLKQYINDMKISNYNDYELNSLLYEEALEIDKRAYTQYYVSLLKTKHLIIFTFFTKNDYNSRIIKISLFFFSFSLYLTVNALFFNYTAMNKIYQDQGSYNFIFQIPQIIYSTLICAAINMLVKTLSLSEKNIVELKREKENILPKVKKLLNCLTIKFILFYMISFIFLALFWYYLGCFCAVYKNTQGHLIKDTFISFGLTLVYPFFFNLLPGFFRLPSLKSVNKDKEWLYKISQILQLI